MFRRLAAWFRALPVAQQVLIGAGVPVAVGSAVVLNVRDRRADGSASAGAATPGGSPRRGAPGGQPIAPRFDLLTPPGLGGGLPPQALDAFYGELRRVTTQIGNHSAAAAAALTRAVTQLQEQTEAPAPPSQLVTEILRPAAIADGALAQEPIMLPISTPVALPTQPPTTTTTVKTEPATPPPAPAPAPVPAPVTTRIQITETTSIPKVTTTAVVAGRIQKIDLVPI